MKDFLPVLDFGSDGDEVNKKRPKLTHSFSRSSTRVSLFDPSTTTSISSLSSSSFSLGFSSGSSSGSDPFSSPESSEPSSPSQRASYVFTPQGFTFVREKDDGEGESVGFFVKDATQAQYLVKPFTEGNKADVIREFLGLTVLKEMIAIVGSSIITPEFTLQKDDASGKFGLFVKMIPDLVLNNQVTIFSPLATPARKKTQQSIASYRDLPLMMVLSMLLGDDDCSPDNSGSLGIRGVRIDLGRAFYWLYANDSDFKTKLKNCFISYKELFPIQKFSGDFRLLCTQLPILAAPECLLKIRSTLEAAVLALGSFIREADLAAIIFENQTIEIPQATAANQLLPSFPENKKTNKTYSSYSELGESFFQMLNFNFTKILPGFLVQVGQEVSVAQANQISQSRVLQVVSSPSKSNIRLQQFLTSTAATEPVETQAVITELENLSPHCSPVKASFSRRLSSSASPTTEVPGY